MTDALRWRPTELARTLLVCAAVALAAAVGTGRWQLVAFAAPMLGVLAAGRRQRPAAEVSATAEPALLRCFAGEPVRTVITLDGDPRDSPVPMVQTPRPMTADTRPGEHPGQLVVDLSADRWGSYPVAIRVDCTDPGGLLCATTTLAVADVAVFPVAPAAATPMPGTELLNRLGTHLTRHAGPGVEYADIRPYVPGDQLRTVNWPVSARRGALHVTERLTDRSMDVAVLVDLSVQPPGPATEATARSVEGAVQVVQSALRGGDRAGLITLDGQRLRWLGPDIGQRQFYRVLDAVLGAGSGHRVAEGTLPPRAAVPPGAVVIAFSTLLDAGVGLTLMDLARRGHTVVAVDVLTGCPLDGDVDPMLERMWALRRSATYRDMRTVGVSVLAWPADTGLEQALRVVPRSAGVRVGRPA